jgi:hypothetical protein
MLLREEHDGVVAIGQPAHAWVSGQLARAWGNERFGEVAPWEEVCLGAEQHDLGMTGWELEPTLNPATGLPHSFIEMPLEAHLRVWSAAPGRMLRQSRYAALLVSMHGAALYGLRDLDAMPPADAQAVRDYLAAQRTFQGELLTGMRQDPETAAWAEPELVHRNQRLVWTWDFLSLALCLNWWPCPVKEVPTAEAEVDLELRPAESDGGRLTLDPWPFAREFVELRCEGRRLTERFDDEAAMRTALAGAPWVTLRFELIAPG